MDSLLYFTLNHGQPSLPTEILLGGLLSKPQRIYEEPETEQQPEQVAAHFTVFPGNCRRNIFVLQAPAKAEISCGCRTDSGAGNKNERCF